MDRNDELKLGSGSLASSPGNSASAVHLARYHNARVQVYYNQQSGVSDTGRVTYIDGTWVELTKDSGERLLVPVMSVRIIKLLETARPEGDAAILLRPAEGQPPGEARQIPRE
jgi:hypothetical protein